MPAPVGIPTRVGFLPGYPVGIPNDTGPVAPPGMSGSNYVSKISLLVLRLQTRAKNSSKTRSDTTVPSLNSSVAPSS
eukprot:1938843-Rhodomonas_salina.1